MAISTLNEDQLKSDAKEYTKWRSKRIGSSDVPVILGESPYKTAFELWQEKTGRVDNSFYTNPAIELGKRFEDVARVNLEFKLDIDFPPTMMVDDVYDYMTSSLDGYNNSNDIVLEIKCVKGGPTWASACEDKVSSAYLTQVHSQLRVSGAKKLFFYVAKLDQKKDIFGKPIYDEYYISDTRLVEVYPDLAIQERIVNAAIEFYKYMTSDTPPPLCGRDVMIVDGDEKAVELLTKKPELIEYLQEKYNHTNFDIKGNKLLRDVNGSWRLTLKKG